ncbi:cell division cycle protein 27 homolog [Coccinella septempunctata]|uniref:cell division cycle protein 27 homolog n=1 Tax=Coccinella septempunctata TaxID=41139 RepID=UPI001D07CF2F|nr:cell division cycle protein 27 homolog [Coccinella septempunctata]
MIIQEPVQASIWHCLNNYDYKDAIFLAERLHAEIDNNETLYLLATSYYRNGEKDKTFYTLKSKSNLSSQCRYLLGLCAFDLEKYAEAEAVLKDNIKGTNLNDLTAEYGDQASFVHLLLGKIANKTERKNNAIESWCKALEVNPFLWSSFEELCKLGHNPNPQKVFQLENLPNLSMCHGHNLNNIESAIINENLLDKQDETPQEVIGYIIKTPQQLFNKFNMMNSNSLTTPEESSPLSNPLGISGFAPILPTTKHKGSRFKRENSSPMSPSFGFLMDSSPESNTPKLSSHLMLMEANTYNQSFPKRLKSQDNLIARKESILQNSKQCISVTNTKTPTMQTYQNVRRSSRLFTNSYSVKENNTSPNQNKFVTPKSPTKKTKQRIPKFNMNKNNFHEINTRNLNKTDKKEKSETITSESKNDVSQRSKQTIEEPHENKTEQCTQKGTLIQKQSAEGLMLLLRTIGKAFSELKLFQSREAIETFSSLPNNQLNTIWVQCQLGVAHFELSEYEEAIKYFSKVHIKHPYQLEFMDIYSTSLWHLQKEAHLSALAQDLIRTEQYSPITWCAAGNCMSLHKEHDSAIKFFQRAVQCDPNYFYAHTLLGHEYITTEELDKAMSCFRNSVRLNPRHYNAWFGMGTIYSKQERFNLAEMNFAKALQINPTSSIILCHLGIIQHAMKNNEKALSTFDLAIHNDPKSPLCRFHRGSVYFAMGRHAEALKELEELQQMVPKESMVYYLIGKIHKKLGNTDLALMYFSWATDLDPKGAFNQMKAAFDPPIGGRSDPGDSSNSPNVYQSESPFAPQGERPSFVSLLEEDSEDSF